MNLPYLEKLASGAHNYPTTSAYLKRALELAYKELGHSHPTTTEILKLYMNLSTEVVEKSRPSTTQSIHRISESNSSKKQKKYVFEHYSPNIDPLFYINLDRPDKSEKLQKFELIQKSEIFNSHEIIEKPQKKISPVKADKRLVDGIYFEGIQSKPRIDRPCRHHCEVPSSAKSTRDNSKRDLNFNSSGRFTPETRPVQSRPSTRGPGQDLPKIRASSSRPVGVVNEVHKHHRIYSDLASDLPPRAPRELPRGPSIDSSRDLKKPQTELIKEPPRPGHPSRARSSRSAQFRKPSQSELTTSGTARIVSPDKASRPNLVDNAEGHDKALIKENNFSNAKEDSVKIGIGIRNSLKVAEKKPVDKGIEERGVVAIQKVWRGFRDRKRVKTEKRKAAGIKAKQAVAELEELKKLVKNEGFGEMNFGDFKDFMMTKENRDNKEKSLDGLLKVVDEEKEKGKGKGEEKSEVKGLEDNSGIVEKVGIDLVSPGKESMQQGENERKSRCIEKEPVKPPGRPEGTVYNKARSICKSNLPPIPESKAEYSDGPIILIQKNIRMFLERKKFLSLKKTSIKLQSFIRMSNVRELFINIRNAIIYIQRSWRKYKSKSRNL